MREKRTKPIIPNGKRPKRPSSSVQGRKRSGFLAGKIKAPSLEQFNADDALVAELFYGKSS
jgi:hypothetical protein